MPGSRGDRLSIHLYACHKDKSPLSSSCNLSTGCCTAELSCMPYAIVCCIRPTPGAACPLVQLARGAVYYDCEYWYVRMSRRSIFQNIWRYTGECSRACISAQRTLSVQGMPESSIATLILQLPLWKIGDCQKDHPMLNLMLACLAVPACILTYSGISYQPWPCKRMPRSNCLQEKIFLRNCASLLQRRWWAPVLQ